MKKHDCINEKIGPFLNTLAHIKQARHNTYNLRQNIVDKFTKLSKIRFPMKCFTADFFAIFKHNCQKMPFG